LHLPDETTSLEESSGKRSAWVRARGSSHSGCSLGNHFEIDSCLGEDFRLFVSLRCEKRIARFKAHDIMSITRRGDEQGMDFFLETARLQAKLVHTAHLRRSGDKFKDFRRNRVIVQDDFGGTQHTHCPGGQQIGVS